MFGLLAGHGCATAARVAQRRRGVCADSSLCTRLRQRTHGVGGNSPQSIGSAWPFHITTSREPSRSYSRATHVRGGPETENFNFVISIYLDHAWALWYEEERTEYAGSECARTA